MNTKQYWKQALAADQAQGIILIYLKLDDFGSEQILKKKKTAERFLQKNIQSCTKQLENKNIFPLTLSPVKVARSLQL